MNKYQIYLKMLKIILMSMACLNAWNVMKCDGQNYAKVKKGKSAALLYAHRCLNFILFSVIIKFIRLMPIT